MAEKTLKLIEIAAIFGKLLQMDEERIAKLHKVLAGRVNRRIFGGRATQGRAVRYPVPDVLFMMLTVTMRDMRIDEDEMREVRDFLFSEENGARRIDEVIQKIKEGKEQLLLKVCNLPLDHNYKIKDNFDLEDIGTAMTLCHWLNSIFLPVLREIEA